MTFDFAAWRARMAVLEGKPYSQASAARDLGKTADMVKRYERGANAVPRDTRLACAALEAAAGGGLKPIKAAIREGD